MIKSILHKIQTPLYLYNESVLERQIQKLLTNKPSNLEIFYAMKGNSNLEILKFYKHRNIGTEIASGGELFLAKKAGFSPSKIIYTGPGKTISELEDAVLYGIKTIHIESIHEAKKLNEICKKHHKKQDILIRINANFEVKAKIQFSGCPSPFGISEEDFIDALAIITELPHLTFLGIHVYNASGILDYKLLLQNIENVFEMVKNIEKKHNYTISVIDFGGGLGIDYSDDNNHVNIDLFYAGFHKLIKRYQNENKSLIMEISRYLVAESGTYITQVIDKKTSRGKVFLITDGGIHHFMRTSLFTTNHSAKVIRKNELKGKELVTITGTLCTNIDVILKQVLLPKIAIGDWILIEKAGCYGLNASINHFLSHEMPYEILLTKDSYKIIRKRGQHQDLLLNQLHND